MNRYVIALFVLILVTVVTAQAKKPEPPPPPEDGFAGTWIAPDEADIPNTPEGDMIRYGKLLLTETYKYLGAESAMPIIGSKVACTNCHLDNGTAAYGGPWSVVSLKYADPGIFSSRTNEYRNVPVRINGCMQRSMNSIDSRQLPEDSYEMQSIIAYFDWLATGMQVDDWRLVEGQGFVKALPDMDRAADPVRGRQLYEKQCLPCHGNNGEGVWNPDTQAYVFPALWGPDTFNNGAGMYRLRTGVRFVKGNMPYGRVDATNPESQLSDEDAWDVMSYVISEERPAYIYHESDWSGVGPDGVPNWMKKRVDAGYSIYFPRSDYNDYIAACSTVEPDTSYPQVFTAAQHKYGPWADMLQLQRDIRSAYEANCLPAP